MNITGNSRFRNKGKEMRTQFLDGGQRRRDKIWQMWIWPPIHVNFMYFVAKKPLNYEETVKDIKHNHFAWVRNSWKNFHYYCCSSSWISLSGVILSLLFHLNINNQNTISSIKIIQTMWSPLLTISVHIIFIMLTMCSVNEYIRYHLNKKVPLKERRYIVILSQEKFI
jgi:hypothetical protein